VPALQKLKFVLRNARSRRAKATLDSRDLQS